MHPTWTAASSSRDDPAADRFFGDRLVQVTSRPIAAAIGTAQSPCTPRVNPVLLPVQREGTAEASTAGRTAVVRPSRPCSFSVVNGVTVTPCHIVRHRTAGRSPRTLVYQSLERAPVFGNPAHGPSIVSSDRVGHLHRTKVGGVCRFRTWPSQFRGVCSFAYSFFFIWST